MNKHSFKINSLRWILAMVIVGWTGLVQAAEIKAAPKNIQCAYLWKVLNLSPTFTDFGDITIYVINAPKFAYYAKMLKGKKVGSNVIINVVILKTIPETIEATTALCYLGNKGGAQQLKKFIALTRKHKVLSVTGNPNDVKMGITLCVSDYNDNPKVLINKKASAAEGIIWKEKFYKIAVNVE